MSKKIPLGPADLGEGEMRGYAIGKRNLLVACINGRFKALDDWCNHAGCLLSGGWLEARKNRVVCPCHEIAFDLDTGKNETSPSMCDDQRRYDLLVEDGQLVVIGFEQER